MGTIYPHSDHNQPNPEIPNRITVIVGATHVENVLENFVFRNDMALFCPHEGRVATKFQKPPFQANICPPQSCNWWKEHQNE